MRKRKEARMAWFLLAPSILLVAALIGYPIVYNIYISFRKVPLNPKMDSPFIGLQNYISTLTDPAFYSSLGVTVLFTFIVVALSTALGVAVAVLMNRDFAMKKLVKAMVILPYIVPSVSLIFAWKYMFNNTYGIINYLFVDVLHLAEQAPLWFDKPASAFLLVVLFCVWKFFPYAFMSVYAILQTVDKTLYEAAEIDGAGGWRKFRVITLQEIKPVLATVITLRTIWVFYMFTEVNLLSKEVKTISVYLYENAFALKDMGKAAAISILLFLVIVVFVLTVGRRGIRNEKT